MLKPNPVRLLRAAVVAIALSAVAQPSFAAPTCGQIFSEKGVAHRAQRTQVRIAEGRQIDLTYVAAEPGQPTFLFLPGVNRGMDMNDMSIKILREEGYGIAAVNFSAQPFSITRLPKGEEPHTKRNAMTMQDFANEANYLIDYLTEKGAQNIIPVSLSFSGATSPLLKKSPLIIDVVPLTDSNAALGTAGTFTEALKGWGWDWIIRAQLDAAYRMSWAPQVDALIKNEKLDASRREDMIQGYIRMSQATEGFKWNAKKLPADVNRVFIVAEGESKSLLKSQLETYLEYRTVNPDAVLFLVKGAGHVVMSDQPAAYAVLLQLIAKGETQSLSGIMVMDPAKGGELTLVPKERTEEFIREITK